MAHRNNKMMIAAFNLASILGIASLGQVHADTYSTDGIFWSSVGAAGQVDTSTAKLAKTSKATITMAASGTLIVRYSVTPSADLATTAGAVQLMANVVDPGPDASVDVSLIEVPVDDPSGTARSVIHLNSSDSDALGVTSFATRCAVAPAGGTFTGFNFAQNAYYIHAVLTWDSTKQTRAPTLRAMKVGINASCK